MNLISEGIIGDASRVVLVLGGMMLLANLGNAVIRSLHCWLPMWPPYGWDSLHFYGLVGWSCRVSLVDLCLFGTARFPLGCTFDILMTVMSTG